MKPRQIKHLDFWVGIPLVFLLTLWRYLILLFVSRRRDIKTHRKIIFIKLTEQGSTVLAYSALKEAEDMVGKENIYFWAFAENTPILEILNVFHEKNVFTIHNKGFITTSFEILKTLAAIKKEKIDTAIDLEFFSRSSAILAYCCGAKTRVGYQRYHSEVIYRGDLMTHKLQYNPYHHAALAYRLMVESLLCNHKIRPFPRIDINTIQILQPIIEITRDDVAEIKKIIHSVSQEENISPIIIINPNAGDSIPARKWDVSNFVDLSNKLSSHYKGKLTIVITGSLEEATYCNELCDKINFPGVINLAGKTNVRQLLALYSLADVLVTNDSGPGQFASLTSIHNIVLFGPETPVLFGPPGKNTHIIESDLSCRPCVNPYNHRLPHCKSNTCMQSISVETVYDKIIEVIPVYS
ncbi:MAG: glycosyltransferase family 9 protein [Bacteroidales bacterium]|nr:glycosyltransferase family 9 protein [Bacteroidales bacterium]HOY38510.1 glycosyltransferase family 9 protein [Bacteroidales bacterium]